MDVLIIFVGCLAILDLSVKSRKKTLPKVYAVELKVFIAQQTKERESFPIESSEASFIVKQSHTMGLKRL